jgi:hypothetical protein
MFTLPTFRTKAIVLLGTTGFLFYIFIQLMGLEKPLPKPLQSSLALAFFGFEWALICFGTIFSSSIREWLFQPSSRLENSGLMLLVTGTIALLVSAGSLYHAWGLFQQTKP